MSEKIFIWAVIAASAVFVSWKLYKIFEDWGSDHAGIAASVMGSSLVIITVSIFSLLTSSGNEFFYSLTLVSLLILIFNIWLFEDLEEGE